MHSIRFLAVLIATVTLTACLNSTTIVKVKPDGSGTVEQTTLVNTSAFKGMMGAQGGKPTEAPVINRAGLERTAERMGKGVTPAIRGDGHRRTASKAPRRSLPSRTST